jgi:hypothetical protein
VEFLATDGRDSSAAAAAVAVGYEKEQFSAASGVSALVESKFGQ